LTLLSISLFIKSLTEGNLRRELILKKLQEAGNLINQIVEDIDKKDMCWKVDPSKWSIDEIIVHLKLITKLLV